MVRHHVKKNKKKSALKVKEAEKTNEELLKDLDRFAGSSEEEGEGATDDESLDDGQQNHDPDGEEADESSNENSDDGNGDSDDDNDDDDDDDDNSSSDEDEYGAPVVLPSKQKLNKNRHEADGDSHDPDSDSDEEHLPMAPKANIGMAGAMARILGISAPTKEKKASTITKAVVLSKTFTPLQKQQKKEKQQQDAIKLKRKQRREVNLSAMHIPLSAATSRPMIGSKGDNDEMDAIAKAMSKEIENESMHRRVATRGVVALFNTIAKHQQERSQQQAQLSSIAKTNNNDEVKAMSKHGFLDMLKKTGATQAEKDGKIEAKSTNAPEASNGKKKNGGGKGWNALKDDFMMNSKLKDWDKALSSDDDDSDDGGAEGRGSKRAVDDDDVMSDDWSSDDEETANGKRRKVTA